MEGESYKFVIQSDSHLSNKADKPVYKQVMESMNEFEPDFMMYSGDTFLNDQDGDKSLEVVDGIYYEQLPYLSTVAKSAPLCIAIGNHEGEYGYLMDGMAKYLPGYLSVNNNKANATIKLKNGDLNTVVTSYTIKP